MRAFATCAALIVPLMIAAPAMAQEPAGASAFAPLESSILTLRLRPERQAMDRQSRAVDSRLASASPSRISASRAKLLGSWAPRRNVVVGVGLFSIPKNAMADPNAMRTNPMKDQPGKTRRIAAVGLSLSF